MSRSKISFFLLSLGIVLLGASFRLTGVNWDSGQHQHPDERFLSMTAYDAKWPTSISEYFNTNASPLNPHNFGRNFYVYGTYPWILVKFLAEITGQVGLLGVTLTGRVMSALTDIGTLIVTGAVAWRLTRSRRVTLFTLLAYSLFTLPIQLSHFFTVDPYLTFFTTLTIFFLTFQPSLLIGATVGTSFGMAIAAKISGIYLAPLIFIVSLYSFHKHKQNILNIILFTVIFLLSFALTVRIFYPYLFNGLSLNNKVLQNWTELKQYDGVDTAFPPALQWIPTQPVLFTLSNLIVWGINPILVLLGSIGVLYYFYELVRNKDKATTIPFLTALYISWACVLVIYQSLQFAKPLRYTYPAFPALAMVVGITTSALLLRHKPKYFILLLYVLSFYWTISFVSIYTRSHTRISASEWLLHNTLPGSSIAVEHWDDPLPLLIPNLSSERYIHRELPLYIPDTKDKWIAISETLQNTDTISIASNRLWRSLSAIDGRYPYTYSYYRNLFENNLGFVLSADITSYMCLIPGNKNAPNNRLNLRPSLISLVSTNTCQLALNDDGAEESFTVYDHPRVLLFSKTKQLSANEIFSIIVGDHNEK